MIKVEELSFSFGNHNVFDNASFTLPGHGLIAVTGRNGVGKTTLLRILGKVYKADFNTSFTGIATYIDSEYLTLDTLTVSETVYMFARQGDYMHGELLISNTLINEQMNKTPLESLSLGQRQRLILAIACTFTKPSMLLLDEPFNGLDFEGQEHARRQLKFTAQTKAILFATHSNDDIYSFATHILHINGPSSISLTENASY